MAARLEINKQRSDEMVESIGSDMTGNVDCCMSTAQVALSENEVDVILKDSKKKFLGRELRIVLIGKTGVGKSATANTIIGENVFEVDDGMKSITQVCEKKHKMVNGRKVLVVDTPGIFDTERDPFDLETEIRECITLTSPGPHAVLFVMKLNEKYKREDYEALTIFLSYFGEEMLDHVIAVFTHGEVLEEKRQTLDEYLSTSAPDKLHDLLSHFGNRKIAFSNKAKFLPNHQVESLFTIIDTIKHGKFNTSYFKNEAYETTETKLLELERSIREEIEEEYYNKMKAFRKQCKEEMGAELNEMMNSFEEKMLKAREKTRYKISHSQLFIKGMILTPRRDRIEKKLQRQSDARKKPK